MMRHRFIFPRGSGGSWLSNMIWNLQSRNFLIPSVNRVFDGLPRSTISFDHAFEIIDPNNPSSVVYVDAKNNSDFLFSTDALFVLYLNDAFKVRYGLHKLADRHLIDQLFDLTNSAMYIFNDDRYHRHYCRNIDLDYRLIFQEPVQFVQKLFALLDKTGIDYEKNQVYCMDSINYYKTTVADPMQQVGDLDNMIWLGACHAILSINNIPIPVINDDVTMSELKEIFAPWNSYCMQKIFPMSFEWIQ